MNGRYSHLKLIDSRILEDTHIFHFYIMRVAHCAFNFMCNRFFKGTLSLSGLSMLLVLRLVHMFLMKQPTKYGFFPLLARPLSSFFEGARSFAPTVFIGPVFFKKS